MLRMVLFKIKKKSALQSECFIFEDSEIEKKTAFH